MRCFLYFRWRASYDAQGPFFGLYRRKDFFADKKLENSFEVKQKNLPLVVEGKQEEIDLNKLYLSFLT